MNASDLDKLITSACRTAEDLGVSVFPVRVEPDPADPAKSTKRPLIKNWQNGAAVSNPEAIEALFREHANAVTHAGIQTGRIVVIDLDGEQAQSWWREHLDMLAMTRTVDTRRMGGKHLFYRVPAHIELRNSAGTIAPGVDFRGVGGFVVDWSLEHPPAVEEVADAPAALIEFLQRASSSREQTDSGNTGSNGSIPPGGRNDYLSREAFRLRKQGASVEQILTALRGLNEARCRPPLAEDEIRTIASGKERVRPGPGADQETAGAPITLGDFYAYMPQHCYIFVPSREMWPASSVNARIPPIDVGAGKTIKASAWLDQTQAVEQMTWAPGLPIVIKDRLISEGGWIERPGCRTFNLYRPPAPHIGDPNEAGPWLAHLERLYPDDAAHIVRWFAHRVQRPEEKLNHALVFGGAEGIGKDTVLEPIKYGVGPWNFAEVNPQQVLGRFTPHLKSVVLRLSEAHDLGDTDRYALHEKLKTLIAAPPDVLRCDEKNLREHSVVNVLGVIITTNHEDGLYIPGDSRRYFVAWSEITKEDYAQNYWQDIYHWYYQEGGIGHVVAHLKALDLSGFDPKAPPPRTPAFWRTVNTGRAPEEGELADALEALYASHSRAGAEQETPAAVTIGRIAPFASESFRLWLTDRRNSRQIPHRMRAVGYTAVPNKDAKDGLWKVDGKRQVIYARRELAERERLIEADKLTRGDRP